MAKRKMYDVRPPQKKSFLAVKAPSFKKIKLPSFNFGAIGVIVVLVGVAVSIFLMHRSASVSLVITPGRRTVQATGEAQARSDIMEASEGLVRANVVSHEKELSGKFKATGLSETASKASGTVTVFNNYHLQQILVEDTRFLSADGKLFYSTEATSIAPGQTADLGVVAAEPGPDYNIKPATFSVPGLLGSDRYTSVYAESSENMEGGDRGEIFKVTENDLARAERELLKRAESELAQDFRSMIGAPYELIVRAIKIEVLDASASAEVGEELDEFGYFLEVRGDGLAYNRDDAKVAVKQYLSDEVKEKESLDNESIEVSAHSKSFDSAKGEALIEIKGSAELIQNISEDEIKEMVAGANLNEAQVSLSSTPVVQSLEMDISPFWIRTAPEDMDRIDVRIKD